MEGRTLLCTQRPINVFLAGLAKLWDDGQSMSCVAGTYGYIAPEYAYTLNVDQKSDVYSFGVVLLELITGRKPMGEFGDGVDIVRWVRETASGLSESATVVDPRLSNYPVREVLKVFKISMVCVEDESSAGPTMRQVVHMLIDPFQSRIQPLQIN